MKLFSSEVYFMMRLISQWIRKTHKKMETGKTSTPPKKKVDKVYLEAFRWGGQH